VSPKGATETSPGRSPGIARSSLIISPGGALESTSSGPPPRRRAGFGRCEGVRDRIGGAFLTLEGLGRIATGVAKSAARRAERNPWEGDTLEPPAPAGRGTDHAVRWIDGLRFVESRTFRTMILRPSGAKGHIHARRPRVLLGPFGPRSTRG
jgi:hypothetical protein